MPNTFETENTAVLVVDLQRENTTDGVWPVEDYESVLANSAIALDACRKAKLPVIYTRHWLDPSGCDAMRYEPRDANGGPIHSIAGSPIGEICDEVAPHAGDIVIDKQKFTAFYGTRLDTILSSLNIQHLVILGVWTEACLETTVWDALWRDYRITLVKDACGSTTNTVHKAAILDMANWLMGGQVIRASQLAAALAGKDYKVWRFQQSNSFPYRLENLNELYDSLG